MKFRETYPDFETYDESEYYMSSVPTGLSSALEGLIIRYADNSVKLKAVCHDLATRIPCEPTTNWGWDWLLTDLSNLLRHLSQGKFYKFMDFIGDFAGKYLDDEGIEDLNDLLKEYEVGYCLIRDTYSDLIWELAVEVGKRTLNIEETKEEVRDICEQAIDHLKQAREHLKKPHEERSRKDAIRDCMSAMESLLKSLTDETDIKDATWKLRGEKRWGPDVIVKDGLSIWNRLHDLYPDIRHGQSTGTTVSDEEALYWVDRITAFVRYVSRRKKLLG
ncbi:hypothetical protein ES702_06514 [subsurface metagenome]